MGRYAGAPAGKYNVTVSKVELPDMERPPDFPPDDPVERREHFRLIREFNDNTFIVVDPRFSSGNTGLEAEITPTNLHVTVDVSPAIRVKAPPQIN
jgi:hypothetical protein